MDDFISVVVPVYNAENSIISCIDSILNQSYKKVEIIIINDGSTDQSLEVIDNNYQNNPNIRIVSNINQGVSITRNIGIKIAQYPYIVFIDSDDICKYNMLETLISPLKENEDTDLAIGGYEVINKADGCLISTIIPDRESLTSKGFAENYFDFFTNGLVNVNWNKIYRKKIIEKYDIKFNINLKLGEDACFNLNYLSHCQNIVLLDIIIYSYIVHDMQATQSEFMDYYEMLENRYFIIKKYLVGMGAWEKTKGKYYHYFYNEALTSICNICKFHITFKRKETAIKKILFSKSLVDALMEHKQCSIRYFLLWYKKTLMLTILYILINKIRSIRGGR